MEELLKKPWIKYLGTAAVGLAVSLALMSSRGLFDGAMSTADVMMVLSDAFFVPGVLLTGVGALVFVAGEGMFDMLAYGVKLIFDVAFRHEWDSFRDYKAKKAQKPKTKIAFLLQVGVVFILLAGVFTGLFYYYYG